MERENKFTILDKQSGKVLYCKKDNIVTENQVAIIQMCTIENSEDKEIFFNFATNEFYTK